MSYTGVTADIPAGLGALMSDRSVDAVPITHLLKARNVIAEPGTWRKLPGAATFGSAIVGAPAIRATLDWHPDATTQRQLSYASDGKVYKDDGAGDLDAVTLVSGLSTTARGQWVTGGAEAAANARKAFLVNGANAVHVLAGNGATMAPIALPPADLATTPATCGAIHQGRLVLGAGHRLYLSLATNHEDFTTTPLQFAVFPGVGERVAALLSFQGVLLIGKYPVGLFWLDDTDPNSANWAIRPISTGLGVAPAPHALLAIAEDVLVTAADGRLHLGSAVEETAGVGIGTSDLSGALGIQTFLRETVNLGGLTSLAAVWDGQMQQALLGLPALGGTANTVTLYLDFSGRRRGEPVKPTWSDRDSIEALALRRGADGLDRVMAGTATGTLLRLGEASRAKDGGAYVGEYQTPATDFGFLDPALGGRRKNFDALEIVSVPTGQWNLSIDTIVDGDYRQTVLYDMGASGATLGGTFILGSAVLGGDAVASRRTRITGNGRRLSLVGRNAGAGEDFSVVVHRVSFRPAGVEEGR